MIQLREVAISDREWIGELMKSTGYMGSEHTFANLFDWSAAYTVRIGRIDNYLLVQSGKNTHRYMMPIGYGDVRVPLQAIESENKTLGQKTVIYSVCKEAVDLIEKSLPGKFVFEPVRDNFDYIYDREKLATLPGKKLHGKRNHIARFVEQNPDWAYERINESNIKEAIEMNIEWCKQRGCDQSDGLHKESCAVMRGFKYYFELGLTGGLLRIGGKVIAFTFGSPVRDDTFVVHVEKAFSNIQGAYPTINQQFVRNELEEYQFINREDDLGDEGLRRAKESYRPAFMYERYNATLREEQ